MASKNPQVEVEAGWAIMGKDAGSSADYEVSAGSTDHFALNSYAQLLRRFSPGMPSASTEITQPDTLPWITVSYASTKARGSYLGITHWAWTDDLDATRRPISRLAYMCVPFTELAKAKTSYLDLHQELPRLADHRSGSPLIVTLRSFDAEQMASAVDAFGLPLVAAAAAAVIRGPHAILDLPREGDADEQAINRLRFLDTVAALLPYGQRCRLVTSTWADFATPHRMRLAPATRPGSGRGVLRWRQPHFPAGDDRATAYHRGLLDLHESGHSLATIIRHLARQTEQRAPGDGAYAEYCLSLLKHRNRAPSDLPLKATGEEQVQWLIRPGIGLSENDAARLLRAEGAHGPTERVDDLVVALAARRDQYLLQLFPLLQQATAAHNALASGVLSWLPEKVHQLTAERRRQWLAEIRTWPDLPDHGDQGVADLLMLFLGETPQAHLIWRVSAETISTGSYETYVRSMCWALDELCRTHRDPHAFDALMPRLLAWVKITADQPTVDVARMSRMLKSISEVDKRLAVPNVERMRLALRQHGLRRR